MIHAVRVPGIEISLHSISTGEGERPMRLFAVVMVAASMLTGASAAGGDVKVNRTRDGVGIQGYDPVSYADGAPAVGQVQITQVFQGTTYRFTSAANRDRFAKDPERYVPQYGGFCAWAVSRGYTAPVDPLAWKIVDGKLYLNYSKRVQQTWEQDVPGNIEKANRNWPGLSGAR
jgi:YHS domain-containing protein